MVVGQRQVEREGGVVLCTVHVPGADARKCRISVLRRSAGEVVREALSECGVSPAGASDWTIQTSPDGVTMWTAAEHRHPAQAIASLSHTHWALHPPSQRSGACKSCVAVTLMMFVTAGVLSIVTGTDSGGRGAVAAGGANATEAPAAAAPATPSPRSISLRRLRERGSGATPIPAPPTKHPQPSADNPVRAQLVPAVSTVTEGEVEDAGKMLPVDVRSALHRHREQCKSTLLPAQKNPRSQVSGLTIDRTVPFTEAGTSELLGLAGRSLTAGKPVALLLLSRSRDARVCVGGDGWEVVAEGDRELLSVRVDDVGGGAYVLSFTPRVAQQLRVCLRLYWPSRLRGAPRWRRGNYTGALLGGFAGNVWKDNDVHSSEWCAAEGSADSKPVCHDATVTGPVPVLPTRVCPTQWTGGMLGSWVKTPAGACEPGYCSGDLQWQRTDGWVFVPDQCYLRVYNRDSAWQCLRGRRLLWFGDSTAKQPATDLLEMLLGVSVLDGGRSFRWHVSSCDGATLRRIGFKAWQRRGCSTPFDLRKWGYGQWSERTNPANSSESIRTRFVWGGGKTVQLPPWGPLNALSLLERHSDNGVDTEARRMLLSGIDELRPRDALFLQAWAWDPHRGDWSKFEPKMRWVLDTVLDRLPKGTAVHWDTAHPFCVDDRADTPRKGCETQVSNKFGSVAAGQMSRLISATVDDYKQSRPNRQITALDRWPMALPFAHGSKYCHFGLHFGSNRQFCHIFSFDEPQRCYRDWLVDKFEIQIWMNAVCAADAADLSVVSQGSIEDGVPVHTHKHKR
eukprot:TRINITY_DN29804_c0_g1_i1.p1 TRINITY_DN29804_c0_g1~~TRINITY_DN29804_c0_g1_i1.p1  ORF type:complete len:793 (+),score=86.21 TRINITY_DN29804_c0_g1_i1:68-2446(+)